jgi:hypothetical protein
MGLTPKGLRFKAQGWLAYSGTRGNTNLGILTAASDIRTTAFAVHPRGVRA